MSIVCILQEKYCQTLTGQAPVLLSLRPPLFFSRRCSAGRAMVGHTQALGASATIVENVDVQSADACKVPGLFARLQRPPYFARLSS